MFESKQLAALLTDARENNISIREAALKAVPDLKEDQFHEKLAEVMGLEYERLKDITIDREVLALVPTKAIFQYNVIPLSEKDG
ncbi:MAG: hypothetical protein GXY61_07305 [Lentisphaerae bacterium]|nr:hypothetical protein [Lentisphaerota bacterium]